MKEVAGGEQQLLKIGFPGNPVWISLSLDANRLADGQLLGIQIKIDSSRLFHSLWQ
jgi:hypothetical protein